MNWKYGLRILAAGIFFLLPWAVSAQQVNMYWNTGGCSQPSCYSPVSAANPLPITGSFSATTTGFPGTTQTTGTPISVTTGGVTGTLPAGTEVVASNVGSTNGAYCKLGASATTSDQLIPPNSWFGFTVGSNTQLTCITSTSTTTVNMVGGAGLPTGSGGGGGGGSSGGTVTQGPTGTNAAAWWVQIGDTTNGPVAVATAGADAVSNTQNGLAGYARNEVFNGTTWDRLRSGTTLGSALVNGAGTAGTASGGILTVQGVASMTPLASNVTQVLGAAISAANGLFTNVLQGNAVLSATNGLFTNLLQGNAVIASGNPLFAQLTAGSAIAGNFRIDQTTPGTTNAVQANAGTNLNTSALSLAATQGTTADAPATAPASTTVATEIALLKALLNVGQYPAGATAITASATGTTTATTATLAGTTGKTTYICGYSIRANATAAATVTNTITGVITATLSSIMWIAPLASGIGVDEQIFNPCIPASGTNTGIAIVSGAPGSGGTVSSKGWGYQL